MSAIDELKNINFPSDLDCAVIFYGDDDSEEAQTDAENAANELLDLRSELDAAKARAAIAEKGWHANEAQLGRDGLIFMECMKLLGLDVSGTDPEAIPAAIKRLKGVA